MNKLRSTAGVTLGELLVTLILVGMLTSLSASGIVSAGRVYNQSKTYAAGRVLLNDAVHEIGREMRFADVEDGGTGYTSKQLGEELEIGVDNGRLVVNYPTDESHGLLPESSYATGIKIVQLDTNPIASSDGRIITINFIVQDPNDKETTRAENIQIGAVSDE